MIICSLCTLKIISPFSTSIMALAVARNGLPKMILTVHDELVCEVETKEAEAFAKRMKKIMESVITLDIPLTVDGAIGQNWRDLQPYG